MYDTPPSLVLEILSFLNKVTEKKMQRSGAHKIRNRPLLKIYLGDPRSQFVMTYHEEKYVKPSQFYDKNFTVFNDLSESSELKNESLIENKFGYVVECNDK